ncbi:MAG: siderophore-interacting protein [Halioglobus sp.]
MPRPTPRTLEVIRSRQITPHMLRVTLGGSEITTFPQDQEGAYIKLMFPRPDGSRPLVRTYTVGEQRCDEIDVDFALHAEEGPASTWAVNARPGHKILIGGPGPKKPINTNADWFLLAGDMTALPAIKVNIAHLPEDARGYVVIEVLEESDIQNLNVPVNIEVHWIVSANADVAGRPLLDRIKQLPWLAGQPAIWAACEFHSMRTLRKYFKLERQTHKDYLYVSSYWKIGRTEDQHKVEKQDDLKTADPQSGRQPT